MQRWDIEPGDIVQVKNGMVEAGKMASRSVALHHEIYRRNPKINSIILTQSPALMGYCTTGVEFNVRTIPESWIFLQDVPRFPFGSQYDNLEGVAEEFKTRPCVLLENDSVIVTGDKLINTFDRLEVANADIGQNAHQRRTGGRAPQGLPRGRVGFLKDFTG